MVTIFTFWSNIMSYLKSIFLAGLLLFSLPSFALLPTPDLTSLDTASTELGTILTSLMGAVLPLIIAIGGAFMDN